MKNLSLSLFFCRQVAKKRVTDLKEHKLFENLEKDGHNELRAGGRNVEIATRNASCRRPTAFVAVKNLFSSILSRLFLPFSSSRFIPTRVIFSFDFAE